MWLPCLSYRLQRFVIDQRALWEAVGTQAWTELRIAARGADFCHGHPLAPLCRSRTAPERLSKRVPRFSLINRVVSPVPPKRSARDTEVVPRCSGRTARLMIAASKLNIHSYTAFAFDPFDEGLMRLYTVAAGQAITNARRWQHCRETVT